MPTYEVSCKECGHTAEVFCKWEDLAGTLCNRCGGQTTQAFVTPPEVHFKAGYFGGLGTRRVSVSWEDADGKKHHKKLDNVPLSKVQDKDMP